MIITIKNALVRNGFAKNSVMSFCAWLVCFFMFELFSPVMVSNVIAQENLNAKYPWIDSEKNSSGLYGIPDGNGGWNVEPVFEFLGSFRKGSPITKATYKDKEYVVDRRFNIVGGPYQYVMAIHPSFAVVEESDFNFYCVNTKGQKFSDVYEYVDIVSTLHEDIQDLMVFAKHKGSADWDILGADGKSICTVNKGGDARGLSCGIWNVLVDNNFEKNGKLIAPLLQFPDKGQYGVMNLEGEIIVPAKFSRIDDIDLTNFYNITKFSGAKCTEDQLRRHTFFACYDVNNDVTLVDATGKVVIPTQKDFKNANAYFKKNKKVLAQYLLQSDSYDSDLKAKVLVPYQAFLERMQKYIADNGLMDPVGNGKNLLAIARNDKAEAQKLLAMQQTKERAAQTAVAAKSSASAATMGASRQSAKTTTQNNISHPAYGTLPSQSSYYYYGKSGGKPGEVQLYIQGYANGGCWISLRAFNLSLMALSFGPDNVKYEGDYIVIGGRYYKEGFLYTPGAYLDAPTVKIAKDWSHIIYVPLKGQQDVYDRPMAASVYKQHEANINRYNAQHQLFEYSPQYQKNEAEHNRRVKEIMRQDNTGGQTTRKTSTTRKNNNSRVDVRVDETNMTGKDQGYKWCDQCKKWDIPHVHIKK